MKKIYVLAIVLLMCSASFAKKPKVVKVDCVVSGVYQKIDLAACKSLTVLPSMFNHYDLEQRIQKIEQDILMLKYPAPTSQFTCADHTPCHGTITSMPVSK